MRRGYLLLALTLLVAITTSGAVRELENLDSDTRQRVTEYALSHAYTKSETRSLLEALNRLPARTTPKPPSLPEYVYGGVTPDDQALPAVVNPVCSECGRVLDLLLDVLRKTPSRSIHIMLLPVDTISSRTAAALLDWLREHASNAYLPTLVDLTRNEPHTAAEVFAIGRNYASIPEDASAGIALDANKPLPRTSLEGPTFFYRGRMLSPVRQKGVAYDPLKNITLLDETLMTIDRYASRQLRK
jgi:hypothetical protein